MTKIKQPLSKAEATEVVFSRWGLPTGKCVIIVHSSVAEMEFR